MTARVPSMSPRAPCHCGVCGRRWRRRCRPHREPTLPRQQPRPRQRRPASARRLPSSPRPARRGPFSSLPRARPPPRHTLATLTRSPPQVHVGAPLPSPRARRPSPHSLAFPSRPLPREDRKAPLAQSRHLPPPPACTLQSLPPLPPRNGGHQSWWRRHALRWTPQERESRSSHLNSHPRQAFEENAQHSGHGGTARIERRRRCGRQPRVAAESNGCVAGGDRVGGEGAHQRHLNGVGVVKGGGVDPVVRVRGGRPSPIRRPTGHYSSGRRSIGLCCPRRRGTHFCSCDSCRFKRWRRIHRLRPGKPHQAAHRRRPGHPSPIGRRHAIRLHAGHQRAARLAADRHPACRAHCHRTHRLRTFRFHTSRLFLPRRGPDGTQPAPPPACRPSAARPAAAPKCCPTAACRLAGLRTPRGSPTRHLLAPVATRLACLAAAPACLPQALHRSACRTAGSEPVGGKPVRGTSVGCCSNGWFSGCSPVRCFSVGSSTADSEAVGNMPAGCSPATGGPGANICASGDLRQVVCPGREN
ncbi:hypothetical protein I4F81_004888 [Pyropia yezoensis]|uniref:Uncharacterized protein n=1 Tax=Pyropia yezoensis TaxID=2788 RepID=A0ACC3BX85_PYRYE|nr:hypothetical protein I4F81_004888 [Neopyropia yezoensis]